jgi:hypothetical protein
LVGLCRAGTPGQEAAEHVAAYVLGKLQAYAIACAAVTSVADADVFYILQSGSAQKKVAASYLWAYTWAADWAAMVAATAKTAPIGADAIVVQDSASGNAVKRTRLDELATTGMFDGWKIIPTANYTSAPFSTSRITMSATAGMVVGLPVRYKIGGTYYYGIVTTVSSNAYIDVAGASLTGSVTELSVGTPQKLHQEMIYVAGKYGDGAADLLDADLKQHYIWKRPKAYLVQFAATHDTAAGGAGTQPKVNVKVNGTAVWTNDSGYGVQLSATPATWTSSSAIAVDTSYYDINSGEALEVNCTVAGNDTNAADLSVALVFVYE